MWAAGHGRGDKFIKVRVQAVRLKLQVMVGNCDDLVPVHLWLMLALHML